MTSGGRFQVTIEVPAELVRRCNGLSMDMGGSVLKVVYRDKDDWEKFKKNKEAKTGKLRLISFTSSEFAKALWHIQDRCHITRLTKDDPTIYTTGIGCHESAAEIKDTLHVKQNNLAEFDCFVQGFCYLNKNISRDEMLLAPRNDVATMARPRIQMSKTYHKMVEAGLTKMTVQPKENLDQLDLEGMLAYEGDGELPITETWSDVYPCLIAMCGSGFAYIRVHESGKFDILDGCNRGGRAFLGMGSLLTGAKSFEELIRLAEEGDNRAVDMYTGDLKVQKDESDTYTKNLSHLQEVDVSEIMFSYGKAVGKDIREFKKADLARSLLHTMVMDTVMQLYEIAMCTKVGHVFLCGSFLNSHVTRDIFTFQWVRKHIASMAFRPTGQCPKLHFIRPGSHLGAIGAMLKHLDEPVEPKRPDTVDLSS